MKSAFVIFCIHICLIQYAFTQRASGSSIVNNVQYGLGTNVGLGPLPGQALGRTAPELGGIAGPGKGAIGPNGLYGMPGPAYGAAMPNTAYAAGGMPYATYGGAGNGDVAVLGELPVAGMTAVTGQVPLTGKVGFNGNVACGGIVTISGSCSCGCNAPHGQMPAYGNKPYAY